MPLVAILCVLYLVPRPGSALIPQELIITGGWAVIGLSFAVVCKVKSKDEFRREP